MLADILGGLVLIMILMAGVGAIHALWRIFRPATQAELATIRQEELDAEAAQEIED